MNATPKVGLRSGDPGLLIRRAWRLTRDEAQRIAAGRWEKLDMPRYSAETLEAMRKLLLSYRDNMRVEVEQSVGIAAKTVADLRALSFWPPGLILNVHVDLDPTLSVVRVERAS